MGDPVKWVVLYDAPGSCSIHGCDPWETQRVIDWVNAGAKGDPPIKIEVRRGQ
jgi:hypothetical protein